MIISSIISFGTIDSVITLSKSFAFTALVILEDFVVFFTALVILEDFVVFFTAFFGLLSFFSVGIS